MGDAMVSRRTSCATCDELISPLPAELVEQLESWMQEAAGESDLEIALRMVSTRLAELSRADRCSVLAPIGRDALRVLASSEPGQLGDIIISLDLYPELAYLLQTNEPILVSDASADEMLRPVHHLMSQAGIISIAAAPFQLAGVTTILRAVSKSRAFSLRDLHLLGASAHIAEHRLEIRNGEAEDSSWQQMVMQIADGVIDISLDGRIIGTSGDFEQRLGVGPEQLIGKYLDEVLQDSHASDARRRLIGLLEGGANRNGAIFNTGPFGRSEMRIQAWGTRIRGPDLRARVAIRRLDDEPGLGDDLFQQAPVPLLVVDRTGEVITAANSSAEELCKTPAAGLVGRPLASLLRGNDGHTRLQRASDSSVPIRVLRTGQGERTIVALVDLRPFSELRRREAQMRASLQRQIDELESLQRRFTERETIHTQFLSTSAHELKTPITVIQSYLEILLEDLAEGLSEQQLSFLNVTYEGVLRLRRLVTDLVDLAALEGGKLQLEIGRVEIAPVVSTVIEEMQALAQRAGISLLQAQLERLPCLRADGDRLRQVLRNLIDNAIKSTPTEGMVKVTGHEDGDSVVLQVCDTGEGIPADQLPTLFDEFTQVNPSRDRKRQGSGLGLTISRRIVQALGGRIEVTSQENIGSVFSVYLPQWPEAAD
jgi:signal transduction histidine kinase